jgi:glycosyltransferase involved in cell wall biosynthesis
MEAIREGLTVTTVSRFMRTLLAERGLSARVVPNGIADEWLAPPDGVARLRFGQQFEGRTVMAKVARWDPDKNWWMAMQAMAHMKSLGMSPLLIARGGVEGYGGWVLERAKSIGLAVHEVRWEGAGPAAMLAGLSGDESSDVLVVQVPLSQVQRHVLYNASAAVLANSLKEPFGLVGLETMAAGGVAVVGATGEDYGTPGFDCLSSQSDNPWELVGCMARLYDHPTWGLSIRTNARRTARRYTWRAVGERSLLPLIDERSSLPFPHPKSLQPLDLPARFPMFEGNLLPALLPERVNRSRAA